MRHHSTNYIFACFLVVFATQTWGADQGLKKALEYGFDRPGSKGDKSFFTKSDPLSCVDACAKDNWCKSFTYVKPGIQGKRAKCWLKNTIPKKVKNSCCISGRFD